MLAVWKLDKPGAFILLRTKKDICYRVVVVIFHALGTNALLFTHQTTAIVVACQSFVARLVADRPVTQLTTFLAALVMETLPGTLFTARNAQISTPFLANAMHAMVFTLLVAWMTRHSAELCTDMRANQRTTAPQLAASVNSTHATLSTSTRALVTTFQLVSTRDTAICLSGRAGGCGSMSARPVSSLNKLLAFFGAWDSTVALTLMATGERFLASYFAFHHQRTRVTPYLCIMATNW